MSLISGSGYKGAAAAALTSVANEMLLKKHGLDQGTIARAAIAAGAYMAGDYVASTGTIPIVGLNIFSPNSGTTVAGLLAGPATAGAVAALAMKLYGDSKDITMIAVENAAYFFIGKFASNGLGGYNILG
jgi:hypothetical protein